MKKAMADESDSLKRKPRAVSRMTGRYEQAEMWKCGDEAPVHLMVFLYITKNGLEKRS